MYAKTTAPGFVRELLDTASVAYAGTAMTASEVSESINVKGYLFVGLGIDLGTVSGTSPTLDADLEISFDDGSVWFNLPEDVNSTTQAAMTQKTSTGEKEFKYFAVPSVETAGVNPGERPLLRVQFTVAGTSPSFGIDNIYLVMFAGTN